MLPAPAFLFCSRSGNAPGKGLMFDQVENFRKAIRTRRARNLVIDAILARPLINVDARGRVWRSSVSGRQRLAGEKLHNEEVIADLERQLARLPRLGRSAASPIGGAIDADSRRGGERSASTRRKRRKTEQKEPLPDSHQRRIQLGEWAAGLCEEIRKLNEFSTGKNVSEQALREQFPRLRIWEEVFHHLYPTLKKNLFAEIGRRRWKQPEIFDLLADVRGISGATLYGHYKEYRRAKGLGRKRKTSKHKIRELQLKRNHSKKRS
jgi:hypothetical protein